MSNTSMKEQKLLEYILNRPDDELEELRGSPSKVLAAIDHFSKNEDWLMNIGPIKGQFVTKLSAESKPNIMIELGGYVGYSAILFASQLIDPKAKYYSFEANEDFARIAKELINLSGLSEKVEIILGKASESLITFTEKLRQLYHSYVPIDFIFIDHWKDSYVPDFRLLESLNLIAPGTVIVADNIIVPGAPEYPKYIQATPEERRKYNYGHPEGKQLSGRWNILYDSHTEIFKNSEGDIIDGVEVTKCLEYLSG